MTTRLDVALRGVVVAQLEQTGHSDLLLTYRRDARPGIDALSVALPVRTESFADRECRTFLDWLLPEKQVRNNIAARIHADPSDTFSLVAEYGRECAGAIQFLDPDAEPPVPRVKWLEDAEFAAKLDDLSTHPFLSLDEVDLDLSLGGVQEKALVVVEGERIGLPQQGAISTHIIKPDISDRYRSVLAEYFALRLARAVGMSTAEAQLRDVGGRWVLFVRRFDRLVDATGSLVREHHETAAQALAAPPERKYELRGGPSVRDLGELLRRCSTVVARDLRKLTTLIVFNALIGNADAHAGNFGLMHYANGATRLAPAYDLVPIRAVIGQDPKGYAMRLGGTFEFGNLDDSRMRAVGKELGVAPQGVVDSWTGLRDKIPAVANVLQHEISNLGLDDADERLLDYIVTDITSRCMTG